MASTGAGDLLPGANAPAGGYAAVTPNDSTDLPNGVCRALYVGGAGTLVIDSPQGDTAVAFVGVVAGSTLSVRAKRVRATSTTATNIVALY